MLRIFCSTNRCSYLAQAGSRDRAALAALRGELAAERAQRAAAWAEAERLRAELDEMAAALAEARASTEFYLDLFCLERARQGTGVRRP